MYSVYQNWDPLQTCVIGKSYPPEFYSFITNSRVRAVMERIARETEEDYQKLIKLLESFKVKVLRPDVGNTIENFWSGKKYLSPPMMPSDYSAMIGKDFYLTCCNITQQQWDHIRGSDWPEKRPNSTEELLSLPKNILSELQNNFNVNEINNYESCWQNITDHIQAQGNNIKYNFNITESTVSPNCASISYIGKDLYFGTSSNMSEQQQLQLKQLYDKTFPNTRNHILNSGCHTDAVFCAVAPGLIISTRPDTKAEAGIWQPTQENYENLFPGWEIHYLPDQAWPNVQGFDSIKKRNSGKWWVPGEELNDEFTYFVESWINHWTGYVEESIFDVNMIVIDEKNVICSNYNDNMFQVFQKHNITPHVCSFRHCYFWDGGIHCVSSDINRTGNMRDYFPERG